MFYLNTTRHLQTPATDETVTALLSLLESQILPTASTLEGIQSISWLLSTDRLTLQAFSGWGAESDLERAEHSDQHGRNGQVINELLGGLTQPQGHSYFRRLSHHQFG